jgi:hypothetical protein
MLQLPVGGRRETPSRQLSGLQTRERGDAEKEVVGNTQDYNRKGVLFQSHHSGLSFAAALRGRTEEQQQPQTHQVAVVGPAAVERRVSAALPQHEQQTCQSVRAPNINCSSLDKMLRVIVTVVHQIMIESNGIVLQEARIVVIIIIVLYIVTCYATKYAVRIGNPFIVILNYT